MYNPTYITPTMELKNGQVFTIDYKPPRYTSPDTTVAKSATVTKIIPPVFIGSTRVLTMDKGASVTYQGVPVVIWGPGSTCKAGCLVEALPSLTAASPVLIIP